MNELMIIVNAEMETQSENYVRWRLSIRAFLFFSGIVAATFCEAEVYARFCESSIKIIRHLDK